MKPKEALNQFYKMNAKMGMFLPDTFTFSDEDLKVVDVFKTLVEQATPMQVGKVPPIKIDTNIPSFLIYTDFHICPICNHCIFPFHTNDYTKPNFCKHCGQALDWEKEKQNE